MTPFARALLIPLAAAALAFAACGDDDTDSGDGTPTSTAGGSPSATAEGESPGASPDGAETPGVTERPRSTGLAPTPLKPELGEGVRQIGEGTITFVLAPNGQFLIDGLGLVQPTEAPPCEAFVFAFSWLISDPSPPGDNSVTWRITLDDDTEDVASGADGAADVGCGLLTATNTGSGQISVGVHYVQGAIE